MQHHRHARSIVAPATEVTKNIIARTRMHQLDTGTPSFLCKSKVFSRRLVSSCAIFFAPFTSWETVEDASSKPECKMSPPNASEIKLLVSSRRCKATSRRQVCRYQTRYTKYPQYIDKCLSRNSTATLSVFAFRVCFLISERSKNTRY